MISEEVKMIQRDHPAPTFREPDPDTLRPPGAGQTVDPEMLGKDIAPGRMGANDTSTQEGPTAQGVGRRVDSSEDVVADTTKMARGARSPHDTVTEPTEGGASVLDVAAGSRQSNTFNAPAREVQQSESPRSTAAQFRLEIASGKYSTSTIAGNRFENFIADQANQAGRKVVNTKKKSDGKAYEEGVGLHRCEFCKQDVKHQPINCRENPDGPNYGKKPDGLLQWEKENANMINSAQDSGNSTNKDTKTISTSEHRIQKTPASSVFRAVVAGQYDAREYLSGTSFSQDLLNEIAKATTMNGTYMLRDSERFLRKMETLIPKTDAAQSKQKQANARNDA